MTLWQRFLAWLKSLFTNSKPQTVVSSGLQAPLSWELPCDDSQVGQLAKPSRRAWSEALYSEILQNYVTFMQAKDIKLIIPEIDSLTQAQAITKLCELFSGIAKYESSWNPKVQAKDVNGRSEPQYMATGLFQLNEEDQKVYRTGTNYTWQELQDPINNIKAGVGIVVTMIKVRGKITKSPEDGKFPLSQFFATLIFGGKYENIPKILKMVYDLKFNETKQQENFKKKSPPWYLFAKKYEGKVETDPAFNKEMSAKWSLFGMNLGTIAQSWAAWCGLAMAVSLAGVGVDYQRNGALARNWQKYEIEIVWKQDGIPQGAIVALNHNGDCNSASGNHVAQANGDCPMSHFFDSNGKLKPGATIDLYGGNQGNTWKVSTYSAKEICAVRWPKNVKDYPKPGPVLVALKCTSGPDSKESTR